MTIVEQILLPHSFLNSIEMSFADPVCKSSTEMVDDIAAFYADSPTPFNPDELTATSPFLLIDVAYQYRPWDFRTYGDDWSEILDGPEFVQVIIRIDGKGEYLTYAEILWQVHRAAHQHLKEQDHKFFEGFEMLPARENDDTPIYRFRLGS
jgi:hypothetical protein